MKEVLLISLQEDLDVVGLRSIHYQLLKHCFASHILFVPKFSGAATSDTVCNLVEKLSPLFIGISLMSIEYDRASQLTHVLKARFPTIPILWGGIHPTIAPETCVGLADFLCIGEGEKFIVEFANAIATGVSPEALGSLALSKNGQLVRNPLDLLITDLDALPVPEHIPRDSYVVHNGTIAPLNVRLFKKYGRYSGATYSIMTTRGCPFSCTYCCNNALARIYGSRKIRSRGLSDVIDELKMAIAQNPFIEYINFHDDCFLARPDEEMEQFCYLYKKEIGRPFIIRSIPTFINERKLALLKAAGLAWISLGLQSGSDHVCRDIYRRPSGKQEFLEASRTIKKLDLAAYYDVILDNPFETDEERLDTVLTLIETPKPFFTQYFSLSLYPGTELRSRALEEGLITGSEYQNKDYLQYNKSSMNDLVRLASFIPSRWMIYILELYRDKPASLWYKINVFVARLFAISYAEPSTYLKVISLSQRRSLGATIRVLPNYMKEGVSRFLKQFG